MFEIVNLLRGRTARPSPRRRSASPWGGIAFDDLELRSLLSGIASSVPAEVATVSPGANFRGVDTLSADSPGAETTPTSDSVPIASADGTWNFHTGLIDGKIAITQTGVKAKSELEYSIFRIVGKGVIRNETLILKFKAFIDPFNAKAKLKGNLLDGDHFTGTLKGNLPIFGKFNTPIGGTRV